MISNNLNKVFYYTIKVLDDNRNQIVFLSWSNLSFAVRLKWDWYFKYRAALLQTKYPRYSVNIFHGSELAAGDKYLILLKNRITSQKSLITKYNNRLNAFLNEFSEFKKNYAELFPLEDHNMFHFYVRSIDLAKSKIDRAENNLIDLVIEYEFLKNK